DPDASLLLVDSFVSGRKAFGENWSFDRFQNQIQIFREKKLIFFESLLLDAKSGNLADRLSPFDAFGMVLWVGPEFEAFGRKFIEATSNVLPHSHHLLRTQSSSGQLLIAPS